MTNLTRAEKRLLQELTTAKAVRKELLKNPSCPLNDKAQEHWEQGVIAAVIRFCDGR